MYNLLKETQLGGHEISLNKKILFQLYFTVKSTFKTAAVFTEMKSHLSGKNIHKSSNSSFNYPHKTSTPFVLK